MIGRRLISFKLEEDIIICTMLITLLMAKHAKNVQASATKVRAQWKKWEWKLIFKKTKLIIKGAITSFKIDNENIKVVDSFCLLGSTINYKWRSSHEICHRPAHSRTAMKSLGKVFRCHDQIVQAMNSSPEAHKTQ